MLYEDSQVDYYKFVCSTHPNEQLMYMFMDDDKKMVCQECVYDDDLVQT